MTTAEQVIAGPWPNPERFRIEREFDPIREETKFTLYLHNEPVSSERWSSKALKILDDRGVRDEHLSAMLVAFVHKAIEA